MATYTTNYNLKKPADADNYDIADANGNMDIIDGALNTLNNQIKTQQDLFTTETLATSGCSITLSEDYSHFMFLEVYISNAQGGSSSARGIVLVPTHTSALNAYYPACAGGTSGYVRIGTSGTTFAILSQNGFATLYLERVAGLIRIA